jgi:hypothetical protein
VFDDRTSTQSKNELYETTINESSLPFWNREYGDSTSKVVKKPISMVYYDHYRVIEMPKDID